MLEKERKKIDEIDQEIIKLLEARYDCVDNIARIKKEQHYDVLDSSREREVLQQVSQSIQKKEYEESLLMTFQSMMDISKAYQREKNK